MPTTDVFALCVCACVCVCVCVCGNVYVLYFVFVFVLSCAFENKNMIKIRNSRLHSGELEFHLYFDLGKF